MLVLVKGRLSDGTSSNPRRIVLQRGQAQGPLPSPRPPLVPTGRGTDGIRQLPYSVSKIIRTAEDRIALFVFLRVRDGLGFDGLHIIYKGPRLLLVNNLVLEDAAQDGDGVGVGRVHAEVGEAARAQVLAACVGSI